MSIKESYNPVEVKNKSRKLMWRSVSIPIILIIIIALIGTYFANNTINNHIEESINIAISAAKIGLIDETNCNSIFNNCEIIYYDENKEYIAGDKDKDLGYNVLLNKKVIKRNGSYYKGAIVEFSDSGQRRYVAIVKDITKEVILDYILIASILALLIAISVSMIAVSYNLIKKQLLTYEMALTRNNNLISDISHEFNTPLAIIKTQLAKVMMEPKKKVEDISDSISIANNEAGRLNRMVREMLVLSKSDANKMIITKKKFNLTDLVEEICEPFKMMCELDNKTLNVIVPKDMYVVSDEDKIKQSIIILLDNAVKYTKPKDSIELSIKDSYLKFKLTVADTGIGVPKEELENVFKRFYRIDESRNSKTGGSGLGLPIVRAISIALGGKVFAKVNKPKGFRVELELPKK